jgi:hypothetical protein
VQNLDISAREVVKELPKGRGDWEKKLPPAVTKRIIEKKLFGFKE